VEILQREFGYKKVYSEQTGIFEASLERYLMWRIRLLQPSTVSTA